MIFYRQIYHLRKKIFARRGLFLHRTVKKNRPPRQQKRQKPRKKPRAVSSRVAPVSVGKDKNRKNPLRRMQMSLTSHGRCSRLKIPRASSGIFSRLHHPPVGFCIRHKAINKKTFLRNKDESLKSSAQSVVAILRTKINS